MNSEEIISRLKLVLQYYNLTSSTFADTIDVQRSSISHLMSGRNKPSLDFILKVVDNFSEVDLYWLLKGIGNFPKEKKKPIQKEEIQKIVEPTPSLFSEKEIVKEKAPEIITEPTIETSTSYSNKNRKLIKVVLLYNDGSFEDYNP